MNFAFATCTSSAVVWLTLIAVMQSDTRQVMFIYKHFTLKINEYCDTSIPERRED